MRAKKFACCLMVMSLLAGISFISCGNSSRAKVESEAAQTGEDFKSFLDKFTSSAAFQYTRVKFPLKTPVTLLADDGETEKTFPFTKEKWPLLDSETLKEERITQEEGSNSNSTRKSISDSSYPASNTLCAGSFSVNLDT